MVLEDLHFADHESLELITQIISARLKMVIVMTYRPEEFSPEKVQKLISPEFDDQLKRGGPLLTRIRLSPLVDDETIQYVSTTLSKPKEDILPLALVIQSKSGGNPFYIREMLSACHRKRCVYYDYKASQWIYDLDRLFEEFQGEQNYDVLDTNFITRRLSELPDASKCLLGWAALIGHSFSFELICHLLSGECQDDACASSPASDHIHRRYTQREAVAGLQAAIQALVIVPSDSDDRFRFAHDRYIQAASQLKICDTRKMHFTIAQILMNYYPDSSKENIASHICESVDIIRQRVPVRRPYRTLLFECAKFSTERGARPTAAKVLTNAVALLQPDPWKDAEDSSYEETNQLYLRAAECYVSLVSRSLQGNGGKEVRSD